MHFAEIVRLSEARAFEPGAIESSEIKPDDGLVVGSRVS
jgi:hypothetical protein